MRLAAALLSCAILGVVNPVHAQDSQAPTAASTQDVAGATQAAERWLALLDADKVEKSWSAAAASVRSVAQQKPFVDMMRGVRAPFGAAGSRTLVGAQYTRSLPGAPSGEYVVIQYRTAFANKEGVETVTPVREADGVWRVSGYYLK